MSGAKPALGYPTRTAAALALRAQGQSTGEIARAIGITTSAAASLLASGDRQAVRDGTKPRVRQPRGGAAALAAAEPPTAAPVSPARPLADAVAAEASEAGARRQDARRLAGTAKAYLSIRETLTPAEAVATMMVEDPADVVLALKRRWPEIWDQVLAAARTAGMLPGAMMVDALEAGLAAIASGRASRRASA